MELVWLVYAISLLHGFGTFFTMLVVLSAASGAGFLIYRGAECSVQSWDSEQTAERKQRDGVWAMNHVKTSIKVMIPAIIILTAIPTEKTAYMMVGAYATQKVAESGVVQETGGKVLTIINQKLDSYIEDGLEEATQPKKKRK